MRLMLATGRTPRMDSGISPKICLKSGHVRPLVSTSEAQVVMSPMLMSPAVPVIAGMRPPTKSPMLVSTSARVLPIPSAPPLSRLQSVLTMPPSSAWRLAVLSQASSGLSSVSTVGPNPAKPPATPVQSQPTNSSSAVTAAPPRPKRKSTASLNTAIQSSKDVIPNSPSISVLSAASQASRSMLGMSVKNASMACSAALSAGAISDVSQSASVPNSVVRSVKN